MDQKSVRTFIIVLTEAVILLLQEQAKKHPTSEASNKAAALLKEFKATSNPTETDSYPGRPASLSGVQDPSLLSRRVPVMIDPDAPQISSRVPIAGTEPRPRDEGEEKGTGGIGVNADLI